jgi:hypothetical protein
MILMHPMSHLESASSSPLFEKCRYHSNIHHLNNGDPDDPINHRTERTSATRAATMTSTATTTAEHKIPSHLNQQQQPCGDGTPREKYTLHTTFDLFHTQK